VHGALALTTYLDNPPANQDTDALFVYISTINMRGRLKDEWSGRGFPGYALGVSPICIPVSAIAAAMPKGKKAALVTTALLMKAQYDIQASYGALGTAMVKFLDVLMGMTKSAPRYARDLSSVMTG